MMLSKGPEDSAPLPVPPPYPPGRDDLARDITGRPSSAVDQLGHAKSQTWTNDNSINTVTNALSQSTTFGYDRLNITRRHG